MASVEDKIVSIKFDNQKFEQNIATTTASLATLSDKINSISAEKLGIDNINAQANAVNLAPMAAGIDNISSHFTALHAVAFTVIQTITQGAMGFASKLVKEDILAPIISGGKTRAEALDQAQFQFRGLGMNVEETMANAKSAVLGTSFGLGEAASAAAQFGASGIKTGAAMTESLRAIAGTAAMTGRSYGEMAMIFTSSAASGKVNNMDLQQFSTRGLNAAAAMAKQTGKTEAQIHEMATQGELDYATFAKSMDGAFGSHATQANETYKGSLDNLHAAFSRLGASFFTPEMEQQRDLFNALTPVVDKLSAVFQPLIQTVVKLRGIASGNLIAGFERLNLNALWGASINFGKGLENIFMLLLKLKDIAKGAFSNIFPGTFVDLVLKISTAFESLTEHLKMGSETSTKLASIFQGFFSVLSIGVAIIKGVASVIVDIIKAVVPAGGGFLSAAAGLGEFLQRAKEVLVDGGKIKAFFDTLGKVIAKPIEFISKLASAIVGFFSSIGSIGGDRVSARFDKIGDSAGKAGTIWDTLTEKLKGVGEILNKVWLVISNWFHELGANIAEQLKGTDFNSVMDVLNVGLLAGIAAMLQKFFAGGVKFGLQGGFFTTINSNIKQVTNSLKLMETSIKAEAILKIAAALGIIALSMIALSMVDSQKLGYALIAMAVGFAELAAVMMVLDTQVGGATKVTILSFAMIGMAVAMDILANAIRKLAVLSPDQLATGLIGVGAALGLMVAAVNLMPNEAKLISVSIAMNAMAIAMVIMAGAIKLFSNMSPRELAKGLGAVAIALGLMVAAMNLMPPTGALSGLGFIEVAIGLNILSGAIKSIGALPVKVIEKGLAAIAIALILIAAAMNLMPVTLPITAIGLIGVAIALGLISQSIKSLGEASIGTIVKGIAGLGIALAIIVVAVTAMQGAIAGAAALVIVSGAMFILAKVIEKLGKLSIGEVIIALLAIAGTLLVLGVAAALMAPVIPALEALAVAVALIGLGFGLFGAAVLGIALGLQILAVTGVAGITAFVKSLEILGAAMPKIAAAGALFVVHFVEELLKATPVLVKLITAVLQTLLETIIKLVPLLVKALGVILEGFIKLVYKYEPKLIKLGLFLMVKLAQGIAENAGKLVEIAGQLITNLLEGIATIIPMIVQAGVDIIVALIQGIGNAAGTIVGAAANLIVTFILELGKHAVELIGAAVWLITTLISGFGSAIGQIITAGANLIISFLAGVASNVQNVIDAGTTILINFLTGIAGDALRIIVSVATLIDNFLGAVDAVVKDKAEDITNKGLSIGIDLLKGVAKGVLDALGLNGVKDAIGKLAKKLPGWLQDLLGITSPSKVFAEVAKWIPHGVAKGIDAHSDVPRDSVVAMANKVVEAFHKTISTLPDQLGAMDEFNPKITPILDLTNVKMGAKKLDGILGGSSLVANVSSSQAGAIASATSKAPTAVVATPATGPSSVTFQQTINAPTELSTNDIYRHTKSQIVLAKEALGIR